MPGCKKQSTVVIPYPELNERLKEKRSNTKPIEPLAKIQISQPYICEQFSFVFFKKIITPFFGFICSWILFFSFFLNLGHTYPVL
ncbi:hypothetical protein [uncultured Gammaproteobacteria bacterium]|nr:hypothetical protein [uncultured Gammaproteobacteria bacterium]